MGMAELFSGSAWLQLGAFHAAVLSGAQQGGSGCGQLWDLCHRVSLAGYQHSDKVATLRSCHDGVLLRCISALCFGLAPAPRWSSV